LNQHVGNYHVINYHTCPHEGCGKKVKTKGLLKSHYAFHHMNMSTLTKNDGNEQLKKTQWLFSCNHCNREGIRSGNIGNHVTSCLPSSPFFCGE
jgi:hypothetical protein